MSRSFIGADLFGSPPPSVSIWIVSLPYLQLLIMSLSRLGEITSFTGSTDSVRTIFSDACAKMTKEEAQ